MMRIAGFLGCKINVFFPFLSINWTKKHYFCSMKQRINWIDWAKAIAASTVVFCHLPQSQEWFYYRYLQAVIIVIFFFLSGYLKKDRGSMKTNWQKYWRGLVAPYILYNLIVYPYWLLKYYLEHDGLPSLFVAMRPIWGAILLQHENDFCFPLNGPLWYLPAILLMHLLIDGCRRTKYLHTIMITLCVISFFLYAANKYWSFAPNLTPMGIFRNLPYYYIGYVFGQRQMFREINAKRDFISMIVYLTVSILFFHWHLHATNHLLHISLFYPVNIGFLFGVMYGCKLLNSFSSPIIVNLSIGTLVIIGLHEKVIGVVNLAIEKLFQLNDVPCYHWYEALPIAMIIVVLLYPIILLGKKRLPILLGKG